jgi:dTDP-4-amino-4,6-dideoxygalactose transaminase
MSENGMDPPFIPHSRPTLGAEEIRRVSDVIASGRIAQGRVVAEFERAFAARLGVEEAVAVGSGTAALHLVLVAFGAGPGTEVVIPSFVCSAVLQAVRHAGARVVLADIDPTSFNIDPADVSRRITADTRAVVVPHMFGQPADMKRLVKLGVPIIEDCAQALGSTDAGSPAGSMGHAAVFSFYATKVITTGEGGMIVARSADISRRSRDLREYDNKAEDTLRFNYKMTEMQAALGLGQLERLSNFIRRRREIAAQYDLALAGLDIRRPVPTPGHIYYRYIVAGRRAADGPIEGMRERGIGCARPVYRPLHQYLDPAGYPQAQRAWERCVSLPIYPSLTETEIERIITAFKQIWQTA